MGRWTAFFQDEEDENDENDGVTGAQIEDAGGQWRVTIDIGDGQSAYDNEVTIIVASFDAAVAVLGEWGFPPDSIEREGE